MILYLIHIKRIKFLFNKLNLLNLMVWLYIFKKHLFLFDIQFFQSRQKIRIKKVKFLLYAQLHFQLHFQSHKTSFCGIAVGSLENRQHS